MLKEIPAHQKVGKVSHWCVHCVCTNQKNYNELR